MTTDDRIQHIYNFLHLQRYLHGLKARVVPEDLDHFVIEFEKVSERQLATLRHRLRLNEMTHIRCRGLEVVPFEKIKKKKKHTNRRNNYE